MQLRGQPGVGFELSEGGLYSRGRHALAAIEAAFGDKPLGLSRVRLVLDSAVESAYDSVQGTALLGVVGAGTHTRLYRDFVVFGYLFLEPA